MTHDRIEKNALLKASKKQVWSALTESQKFGSWFGMKLNGPFTAGKTIQGAISPTTVDVEVAQMQKPYEGKAVELFIDRIEPESLFSFKWHPYAIDAGVDYSKEPMTTITFTLEEKENETRLTVIESGFETIPVSRRAEAMKANDGGWSKQMELIAKYLAKN